MKLTGTIDERIDAAVEFGRAHRQGEYDEKKAEELYRKAGVPFPDSARKFWRDWAGVLDEMIFYNDEQSIIDFSFCSFTDAGRLNLTYGPSKFNLSKGIRDEFGDDAVPVAEGGYYYPCTLWAIPDGRVIGVMADDESAYIYDQLECFLYQQFEDFELESVEVITDSLELTGSLEERARAAIDFAKEHDGFEYCRIECGLAIFDFSELINHNDCTESGAADILREILMKEFPDYCTFLEPSIIRVIT